MVSPFGQGVPGLFLDGDAGDVFARALREAEQVRPQTGPHFAGQDARVLIVLLSFTDKQLACVRNADVASLMGISYHRPIRDALRKLSRMNVVQVSGQGKARQIKIDRVLAGQLLALVFPAQTVAGRAPQPSAARE
jgi:hypothetical protein